ncbi:pre-rRNA-processing protein TSR2 homolog [Hippocampus comes]|uniref:pre-rRNA-processing protein TSR2 homolog n=1 Tax=Hippocampus comes TaxID=109280 RepID=UPI00094F0246|nr:PREDICTED: pre-rRNA-processing protein TSR2 homolog [Hippocampus comes]
MPVPADMAASADSRELFADAVRATLSAWPALQIAVDNGFGGAYGQQKADWLADVVQQYFHDNPDLAQDEVEDFIGALMDQEFHTLVDDGSLPQMCVQLMRMFSQWQQGALQQLSHSIHLLTQKQAPRAKVTAPPGQSDSDSDGPTQVRSHALADCLPYTADTIDVWKSAQRRNAPTLSGPACPSGSLTLGSALVKVVRGKPPKAF